MHRRFFLACACLWLGVALPLRAQRLDALITSDANGQFNFWTRAKIRPDNNYTNGASLTALFDGALLWGRLVAPHTLACGAVTPDASLDTSSSRACTSTDLRFGQDMYTPTSSQDSSSPVPGQRPYAGWLYLAGTGRVATPTSANAVTLELGVTGSPSLAEKVQTEWHALIAYHRPLGWSHQIPFHAGVLGDYEHDHQLVSLTSHGSRVFALTPLVGATVGNVLDGARAGVNAQWGYHVPTMWTTAERPTRFSIYALSGAQINYVWYNLFLDQPTTRPSLYVDKLPWVAEYQFGAGVRIEHFVAEYRATTKTREYVTGRTIEPYSAISVGWHR